MIAAERTGRQAVLLEIDPAYVDVIVRRWQDITGEVAVLDGEDRTFDDVTADRASPTRLAQGYRIWLSGGFLPEGKGWIRVEIGLDEAVFLDEPP